MIRKHLWTAFCILLTVAFLVFYEFNMVVP